MDGKKKEKEKQIPPTLHSPPRPEFSIPIITLNSTKNYLKKKKERNTAAQALSITD